MPTPVAVTCQRQWQTSLYRGFKVRDQLHTLTTQRLRSLIGALAIGLVATSCPATSAARESADDEVHALVAEVMSDAERRSSLATSSGSSAGKDGFVISSQNDHFRLRIGGYTQFRYLSNIADSSESGGGDDFEGGFKFQRTRLMLVGRLDRDWDFYLLPAAGPDGNLSVLDAWGRYSIADSPFKVRFGQFKLPIWREWLVTERSILPVERSQLTGVYSSLYSQGAQLEFESDDLRISAAWSDGFRTANTDFDAASEADYAFTVGIDLLALGAWKQFDDFTSLNNSNAGLLLSAGAHYQGPTESFRGIEVDRLVQVAGEASAEGANWSLLLSGVARWVDPANSPTEQTFGVLAQASAFLTDRLELFGRYEALLPDESAAGDELFDAVTVGLNHYVHGHALKFTLDTVYFFDGLSDTSIIGLGQEAATGLLGARDGGQVVIRAQIQLVF